MPRSVAPGSCSSGSTNTSARALKDPKRPYVCVSGGAKVSTKLGILNNLLGKVDDIIIGGAMANTFLLAKGYDVGQSLVEPDLVEAAAEIMNKAESMGSVLHLPVDFRYAKTPKAKQAEGECRADAIPSDALVLDIGPETIADFVVCARAGQDGRLERPHGAVRDHGLCQGVVGGLQGHSRAGRLPDHRRRRRHGRGGAHDAT